MQTVYRPSKRRNQKKPSVSTDVVDLFLAGALGKAYETCDYITGLQAYTFYVQSSLSAPHCTMIDHLAAELDIRPDVEGSGHRALCLINRVMEILHAKLSDDKVSIDDIVSQLLISYTELSGNETDVQQRCRHLVFLTIGLSTMLFKPGIDTSLVNFQISRHDNNSQKPTIIGVDNSRRPIAALLNGLGVVHSTPGSSITRAAESVGPSVVHLKALTSANISFSALKTLGRISIRWVDSMDGHLEFDAEHSILSLFRYPSFCIAAYVGGANCLLAK